MLNTKLVNIEDFVGRSVDYVQYVKQAAEQRLLRIAQAAEILTQKNLSPYVLLVFGSTTNQRYVPGIKSDIDYLYITQNNTGTELVEFEKYLTGYDAGNYAKECAWKKNTNNPLIVLPQELDIIFNSSEEIVRNAVRTGLYFYNDATFLQDFLSIRQKAIDVSVRWQVPEKIFPSSIKFLERQAVFYHTKRAETVYDIQIILRKIKTLDLLETYYPQYTQDTEVIDKKYLEYIYYSYLRLRDYYFLHNEQAVALPQFAITDFQQLGEQALKISNLPGLTSESDKILSGMLKRFFEAI